jgi:hypothetical protein
MTTEDIALQQDGSWVGLPLLGEQTIIFNGSGMDCYIRFGAASTSYGMLVANGSTVVVDETVYVKPKNPHVSSAGSLRVTR